MRKRLNDILDLEVGLFRHIQDPIWKDRYDSFDMDLEFITSYGERLPSPLVKYFIKDTGKLNDESAEKIINLIYKKYLESWTRKYEILDTTYEVLDNYLMKEKEVINRETLDKNLSEIVRNSKESRAEIKKLLQEIENNENNTLNRINTEKSDLKSETDGSIDGIEMNRGKDITDGSDTLSFLNRTDSEVIDMEKKSTSKDVTENKDKDSLSFLDRKDISDKTGFNQKDERNYDHTDSTESLTFLDRKDTSKGTVGRNETVTNDLSTITDGNNTDKTDNVNYQLAYNSLGGSGNLIKGAPATSSTTDKTSTNKNSVKNGGNTKTSDNSTTSDINTKTGRELTSNVSNSQGGVDTTDNINETDTIEKLGSEINTKDGSSKTDSNTSELDKGSNITSKDGQEITSKNATTETELNSTTNSTNKSSTLDNVESNQEIKDEGSTITKGSTKHDDETTVDTEIEGTDVHTQDNKGELDEERTLERSGNIGVMTTADILRGHIEFWNFSFLDEVYKDVIEMMGLLIF